MIVGNCELSASGSEYTLGSRGMRRSASSGVTLISLGLIGDYISRIYDESKGRPLYVVEQATNFNATTINGAQGLFLEPKAITSTSATSSSI